MNTRLYTVLVMTFTVASSTLYAGTVSAQTPRMTAMARQRVFTATASALGDGMFTPGEQSAILERAQFDLPPEEIAQLQTRLDQLAAQYPASLYGPSQPKPSPQVSKKEKDRVARRPVTSGSSRAGLLTHLLPRLFGHPAAQPAAQPAARPAPSTSPGSLRQTAMLLVGRPFVMPPRSKAKQRTAVSAKSIAQADEIPAPPVVSPVAFEQSGTNADADRADKQ